MQPVRILLVDDHPVVRRGLRALLEGQCWVGEVLEGATITQALSLVDEAELDIVVLDVLLPDGNGVDALAQITESRPDIDVIILTLIADRELEAQALAAGARRYIVKSEAPEDIVTALESVATGYYDTEPRLQKASQNGIRRAVVELPPPFDTLTTRERQILALLVDTESGQRIARSLGIRHQTVRNKLTAIYRKLSVSSAAQAVKLTRDSGIDKLL